jgi:hypothetical protein
MDGYLIGLIAGLIAAVAIVLVQKWRERGLVMTPVERADYLSKRRARVFTAVAVIFISQQAIFFSDHGADRPVDHFKIAAWLVLSVVLLLALCTGGEWFKGQAIRALMNDEVTRGHRMRAMQLGFLNAMLTCVLLYFLAMLREFSARDAIHIIMTVGIGSAILSFAVQERRALRDA